MEILWDGGEMAAVEVREILCKRRPIARETVKTVLARLEEYGWLTHRVVGRTHFYSTVMPREATVGQRVVELLDGICGGSPERLVNALLDYRGLSKQEAESIREMIDDSKTRKGPSGKRTTKKRR